MDRKLGLCIFLIGLLVVFLFVEVETRSVLDSDITMDIPLWPGWNLISFPLLPTNNSVQKVFSNVTGFSYLYYYNAAEPDVLKRWKIWDNTLPPELWDTCNTLWYVEPNRAYWLWIDYEYTSILSVTGTVLPDNSVPLYAGYNFVGFQMYNDTVQNAVNQLIEFRYLYWYDASESNALSRWKIWDNTISPEYYETDNTLKRIEPTRGYWLWVGSNQTWYEELT